MPREKPTRASRRGSRPAPSRGGNSAVTLLLGVALGLLAAFAAFWGYHRFWRPAAHGPVAPLSGHPISPSPSPHAAPAHLAPTHPAPPAQAAAEPEAAPFGISEDVFESGARLYSSHCASCHGTPRHTTAGSHPTALQLWQPNRAAGGTGVSHQAAAQIHRSIAQGQPAVGMPAYRSVLTDTQLWQLSLLLSNAGQDLPNPVLHLLDAPKP